MRLWRQSRVQSRDNNRHSDIFVRSLNTFDVRFTARVSYQPKNIGFQNQGTDQRYGYDVANLANFFVGNPPTTGG
jgi:hypothetical protein